MAQLAATQATGSYPSLATSAVAIFEEKRAPTLVCLLLLFFSLSFAVQLCFNRSRAFFKPIVVAMLQRQSHRHANKWIQLR